MSTVRLTEQQKAAVENRGGNLLVAAAAGSGKTKVMVERIMSRICDEGYDITDLLIITYTKAAASELRAKIAAELASRLALDPSNKHISNQMRLIYTAQISTVHSFCADLLRTYTHEATLTPGFRIGEEVECVTLKVSVMDDLLESLYNNIDKTPDIKAFIDELAFGRDDSAVPAIIYQIYDAIKSHPWPYEYIDSCLKQMELSDCTDACKTPWGQYILNNVKEYIRAQLPNIETTIELCKRDSVLYEAYGPALNSDHDKMVAILTSKTWNELVEYKNSSWSRLGVVRKSKDGSKNYNLSLQEDIKKLRDSYKRAIDSKLSGIYGDSAEVIADLGKTTPSIKGMFQLVKMFDAKYAEKKEAHNILDFNDLEHKTIELLIDPKDHSKTEIAQAISHKYVEIMVDEYQDTNAVQETIFDAISNGTNRFMVGDVKQSIYMFRLADPSIFLSHYNSYVPYTAAKDGEPRKIVLTKNFRSNADILSATNEIMYTCMSPTVGGVVYNEDEILVPGRDYPESSYAAVELHAIDSSDAHSPEMSDDEEFVTKADIESKYVATRVKQLLDNETIIDDDTGKERPIVPSDIAIIMRSTKNSAKYYLKALSDLGIPATSQKSESLLDTLEIATLYCYLQVINNPRQDIPLVAVLASPLGGFTSNDLARIRSSHKTTSCFYEALLASAAEGDAQSDKFVMLLNSIRSLVPHTTLSKLFSTLLETTYAEEVYGSMVNGEQRIANIHAFFEIISRFEKTNSYELFDFICYIESIREQGIELPQPMTASADDAVSILSVHSSKGLEYPIVILADTSRKFNRNDLKSSALMHKTLGVGVQVVDKELMYRYPTIARNAISTATLNEIKSEELRILYVALTRAKQRLIITYCNKLTESLSHLCDIATFPLNPIASQSILCPGDWIMSTALMRSEATELRKIAGNVPRAGIHTLPNPWTIVVSSASDISPKRKTVEELETSVADISDPISMIDYDPIAHLDVGKICEDISYKYKYSKSTSTPARIASTDFITSGKAKSFSIKRPNFAGESADSNIAEQDKATLTFLRYADYMKCCIDGMDGIKSELSRLVEQGFILEKNAKYVLTKSLYNLFSSTAGIELATYSSTPSSYRNFPFSVLVKASDFIRTESTSDEPILLQGIVNFFIVTEHGIVLYDYKTDFVSGTLDAEEKARKYAMQVFSEAYALKEIFNIPVIQKNILFVRSGKIVRMSTTRLLNNRA